MISSHVGFKWQHAPLQRGARVVEAPNPAVTHAVVAAPATSGGGGGGGAPSTVIKGANGLPGGCYVVSAAWVSDSVAQGCRLAELLYARRRPS